MDTIDSSLAFIKIGCHINVHWTPVSYLVIPAFLASDETDALLARSRQLLDEFSLQDHPLVRSLITKSSLRYGLLNSVSISHTLDQILHRRKGSRWRRLLSYIW